MRSLLESPRPQTACCPLVAAYSQSGKAALAVLTSLACCLAAAAADDPVNSFQGEWRTTEGVVKLEQKGNDVTGTYGAGNRFTIKGTAKGNVLTFDYAAGQVKGNGRFTIEASPNAFTGHFEIPNVRRGVWNGWRPDPKAPADKPASFAGLWLTDLGLMELTQTGAKSRGNTLPRQFQHQGQGRRPPARLPLQELRRR